MRESFTLQYPDRPCDVVYSWDVALQLAEERGAELITKNLAAWTGSWGDGTRSFEYASREVVWEDGATL